MGFRLGSELGFGSGFGSAFGSGVAQGLESHSRLCAPSAAVPISRRVLRTALAPELVYCQAGGGEGEGAGAGER